MVRHPERRLASAFLFQKRQKTIGRWVSFERWLSGLKRRLETAPYRHDNHARPMWQFLPDDTAWFRIEDGLQPFVDHLDGLFAPGPDATAIGHEKKSRESVTVSDRARSLIREIYAEDYDRFGYEARP